MEKLQKIGDRIYWKCVNDRRKALFENMWPLPYGVSYNSYLIRDEKCALMDTVEAGSDRGYADWVDQVLEGRPLDYLVVHHMELDHSGEIVELLHRHPEMKIVGNQKTFKVLGAYFGCNDRLMEVKDGETLSLGHHTLKFVFTPWVHWPETMMSYDLTEGVLFTGDAFGMFGALDGGRFDDQVEFAPHYETEMRRYYSNIVGKYSAMVQKALEKLSGVEVATICPLHGLVWRHNPSQVIGLYDRWSRYEAEAGVTIIYASMYDNTARMADYIACGLADRGVRKIRVHDISKTHLSYLLNDLWLYRGVMLGSCAYNMQMFPLMENLTRELEHIGLKNRYLGLFGTFSWNGGGVKNLNAFSERIGWESVAAAAEIHGVPHAEKRASCDLLVESMAARLLQA
ncbi:MAG: FprA family A-type flavoprotein [Alistipes sp.]|nr:FprA family A-type flavoprotein [Alistipes sp.]